MIQTIWKKIKEAWPINRVVTVLTPIAFVPLAGFISAWVAQHFPGIPPVDSGWLAGIFIVGATAALTAAYKWLDGWQDYEKQIADPTMKPILAPGHADPPPVIKEGGEPLPPGGDEGDSVVSPGLESGLDDDALLSQPDDIAESDADSDLVTDREESELGGTQ